jgi:hypothetical protein
MLYIDKYIHIYKFKYVYVHIRVRQQLEYTLKLKIEKKRNETYSRLVIPTETKGGGRRCWRAP